MKVEVSNGEVVDKITILQIKETKIKDEIKLANIRRELQLLTKSFLKQSSPVEEQLISQLREINLALWEIEDRIRVKEANQEFDQEFIELARSVYFTNDKRAAVKKQINIATSSQLTEEKQYVNYG